MSASRMLERYVEERKIGEGSFGTVHLVRDKRTNVRRVVRAPRGSGAHGLPRELDQREDKRTSSILRV